MACSPELQSLWKHFHNLQCSIRNPEELAEQLAQEASAVNLVPTDVKEQICNNDGTMAEKTRLLILRIEQGVASNPLAFHFFLAIISNDPSLAAVAGQLRTSYAQQTLGDCVPVEPSPQLMAGEIALNSVGKDDVEPCLRADSNASEQRFVPPSGTSQVSGQSVGAVNPPQLSTVGVLSLVAPSQRQQDDVTILTERDLHNLAEIMRPAAPQWRTIGGCLGILDSDLGIIQHKPALIQEGPTGYLREMLSQWLKWAPPNHPSPTLEDVVVALQNIGHESLAVNLKPMFLQRKGSIPESQPAVKRMRMDDSQVQTQDPIPTISQPTVKRMRLDDSQGYLLKVLVETVRTVYRKRPEVREDCWPPVRKSHYINLALIENQPMDFGDRFSCYTVRGSVDDDIVKSKNKIDYSCIFENATSGSRILLEGRPGSGKTTLMNKVSRDWAQGKILNGLVSLLILVPLRQLASETEITLETLLSLVFNDKVQELGQHIQKTCGEDICFALDGLDEYSPTKGHPDFVHELIRGNFLPKSIVVVASRPAASQKFRRLATKNIEVLGFLKDQIYEFVSDYYHSNQEIVQELKLYLEQHPNVMHMCYLPIHAAIVTFLFGVLGSQLPETETEIYMEFTLQTLIRTLKKSEGELADEVVLEHFKDLSTSHYQTFFKICEVALHATEKKKQGFLHKEVKDFFPLKCSESGMDKSLGLITIDHQVMRHGSVNTYSYLHLTFQEFLAAYYLTTLDIEEQYQRVSNYHKKTHMHVVCKFFCGLMKLRTDGALKCFQSIISGAPPCTLLHLHCTYESQSEVACHNLVSTCNGVLCLKKENVNSYDCTAIQFILASTGVQVEELNLESCHIGQECFETLANLYSNNLCYLKRLSLSGTKVNDPSAAKALGCFLDKATMLSSLIIERCGLQLKEFVELAPLLPKLSQLEALSIQHNSLAMKAGESLRVALKDMLHLKELDIDTEVLRSSGVYELYQLCKSLKTVRVWRKHQVFEWIASSSEEAVVRIHDVIQKDGSVLVTGLSTVLHRSGFPRLQFKRERNVDAAPRTDSLESVKIKIDLPGENIGDAGCIGLVAVLKEYKELQALDLDGNGIRQEGCSALTAALQQCKQLQVLSLDSNNIGGAGCAALSAALQECKELQQLHLDGNGIGQEGCSALTAALQQCKQLQVLSLACNIIWDEGLSILARGLKACQNLNNLNLSRNEIGEKGVSILVNGLKECQNLKELYLSWNKLTDASIEPLITLIKTLKSLTTLRLRGNNFTEEGKKQLQQAAEERRSYPDFVELHLYL